MEELPKPLDFPENLPFEQRVNVLLVDDQPANLLALEAILQELGHNLVKACSGEEALQRLLGDEFAVLLLDVQMPGLDGFETAKLIRSREESRHTPIIFLTAFENDRFPVEKAYSLGAVDYLVKPLVPVIVQAKVAGFVELFGKTQQIKRQAERLRQVERREFEQRLAEENVRLREQQELLRVTLTSIGDAVIATDIEGRVTFLNPVAQGLTRWTQDEAQGRPLDTVFKIVNEQTRHPVENPVVRVLKEGHAVGLPNQTVLIGKDGTERPIDDSAAPIRDVQGRLKGVVLVFRDITERRRAEDELALKRKESDRRRRLYEAALSNTPDLVYVFDLDHRFTYANEGLLAMWGRTWEEVIGKNCLDLGYEPWHAAMHDREIEQVVATKQPFKGEVPFTGTFGRRIYEYIFVPVLGENGEVEAVAGTTRDVTDRRQAEEALREIEARFTAILNHSPSCIFAKDRQGRYLLANKALGEFTGRNVTEILGRTDADLFPAEVAARFARDDGDLLASGSPRIYEESFPHANSTVTALTVKFPLVGTDGIPYAVCGIATDISDRKRAQDALRESERRWRSLAEALPNLVWTDLPDGQCDYLSSQWATYTGIPVSELLGLNWLEQVIHPDDRERTAALWKAACEDKADYDLEYRIRRHDGQYHWFKTRGVPIRDEQGGIVKWFGTCTDIEDQKHAHEALAQSEVRFRQLADAMPQIVWTARPDGNIDYLNRRWTEFTGLPQTAGNDAWGPIMHSDEAQPARERWAASVRSGAPFEMELRLLDRRQQTYRWHLIRTVAVYDDAGKVTRWFGTSTDIHEQKRAEESSRYLAEASAALAGVVDYESTLQKVANLAVPYFADWSAVDVAKDGSLRRLGVAHQDPEKIGLAQELMRQYPPDPQAPIGVFAVLRTGKPEIVSDITDDLLVLGAKDEQHLRLIRSLGLKSYICVPLIVSGNAFGALTFVTAESGRRYAEADLVLAMDLAHRAAVAIENTHLYQALRETDRRKDEFLATLAHELRNPLAPIRNSLQILKMPRVDAETVERSRDMMERQVDHLVRLVDDLLDVSRVMRGKIELRRERVELATVVARAVETVQPLVDAQGHHLSVRLPSESLPLDGDPVRLAQVVGNLLTNAAKYTESNGRLWLTAERDGDVAVFRVGDNGIGIAPNMLPRIFELFVQVDHASTKAQGGLGIGLTLVKNLVEMHNGRVEARSAGLGKGSEFVVRLPISAQNPDRDHESDAGQQAHEPPSPSGYCLLVVDDNQDAANSLAMLLKLQGHEVRVAFSGMAALEMTKTYTPDVVFMDIGMPGMDGYEVARRMRQKPGLENVVLAALTGWGQKEDRCRTAEAGFNHHLVKPPEPKAVEGVLAVLRQES